MNYNYNFAKLVGGEPEYAPLKLQNVPVEFPPENEGGELVIMLCTVSNPTAAQYAAAGYLPVVDAMPDDAPEGKHYEPDDWAEENGQIVRTWALVDDPAPSDEDEISAEEALDIIFGGDENVD